MNKKRLFLLLLSLASLAGVSSLAYSLFFQLTEPEAEEISSLFATLQEAESYTFASQAYLQVGEDLRQYYALFGEKAGESYHLDGTVLGTPVELYLVNDMLYQQLPDGSWRVSQAPDIQGALALFAELDPLSAFEFTGIEGFTSLGLTQLEQGKAFQVELTPIPAGWVAEYFTDVKYLLRISARQRELLNAQLTATLKQDPNSVLTVTMELYDVNQPLSIRPPEDALAAGQGYGVSPGGDNGQAAPDISGDNQQAAPDTSGSDGQAAPNTSGDNGQAAPGA